MGCVHSIVTVHVARIHSSIDYNEVREEEAEEKAEMRNETEWNANA